MQVSARPAVKGSDKPRRGGILAPMSNPRIGPPPSPTRWSLAEWFPFGLLHRNKPRHFREMVRVALENLGRWRYAWRILKRGVCDGCSLGPRGLRDDVMDGIHLCTTRLRLLKFNTMGALDPTTLADAEAASKLSNQELQALGRLPCPMIREPGAKGFRTTTWDEAIDRIASHLRAVDPGRTAWYCTSRGISNEGYYSFQKVARCLGSPHIDNAARLCHAPSVVGLQELIGVGAPTCSLKDMIGTDLLVLWGTNLANNQPVATKYLHFAKREGTRIAVINPYREPGLERYWVPSVPWSAVFGTRLMDDFYPVAVGGDIAFANGVLKALKAMGGFDMRFIETRTTGFEELSSKLDGLSWEAIEASAGLSRAEIEKFAAIYAKAKTAVFVWSMGLTQRTFGVQNVRALTTVALARGMVGRPKTGLLPIRGHSGVQGGAECGAAPNKFPSGLPVNPENAARLARLWGCDRVPARPGLTATEMIDAAHEGRLDLLYCMGGNFFETLPDPSYVAEALGRIPMRVHQDIVVNSAALIAGGGPVVLLPAMTRYEMPGGCTQTSTERRIRFSPEIPGPRIPEAKPEWEIPVLIAKRVLAEGERLFPYLTTRDLRQEMDRTIPLYAGIGRLQAEGDQLQWGGEILCRDGHFQGMPGGRARLSYEELPQVEAPEGRFHLVTRRGKQFNSMVFDRRDPLTGGTPRTAVFLCRADAEAMGMREGARATVVSAYGRMEGIVHFAEVRPRTVQVFWPEGNALLPRALDPVTREPADNVLVRIEAV